MDESGKESAGIVGQWAGMLTVMVGIAYEIAYQADIGWLVITAGSFLFACATKLRGK